MASPRLLLIQQPKIQIALIVGLAPQHAHSRRHPFFAVLATLSVLLTLHSTPGMAGWNAGNDEANRTRAMKSLRDSATRADQNAMNRQAQFDRDNRSSSTKSGNKMSGSNSGSRTNQGVMNFDSQTGDDGPQAVVDTKRVIIFRAETTAQLFTRLETEASNNNVDSQYALGALYYAGWGGKRNDVESRRWYLAAAQNGHAESQGMVGYLAKEGMGGPKSEVEAKRWLKIAADKGDTFAELHYALLIAAAIDGKSSIQYEPTLAASYAIRAADKGDISARALMGFFYLIGEGVAVDETKAAHYLRAPAESGDAPSMELLGNLFCEGKGGLKQSDEDCVRWLSRAADLGIASAQANFGFMLATGQKTEKDVSRGVSYVRKSAAAGHYLGQDFLGLFYYDGLGVAQDYQLAMLWLRRAAAQGFTGSAELMATDKMKKISAEIDRQNISPK